MANCDFETFRQYLIGLELSERTNKGYLTDLNIFARWFEQTNEEELSPHSLTPTDIQKAKATIINRHLSALRAYGNWAKVAGVISYNPFDGIKSIDQQSHAPKWLDRKQQAAIIREAEFRVQSAKTEPGKRQAIRDHCVLIVLLNTGLRVSELVALEMTDISLSERKAELRVRLGKSTKQRVVPVNDTARKALKAWYEVRPDIKTQRVFITQRGPATVRAIQSILEDLGKDTHIEKFTPHMARHSFVKNLVNSVVTLEKVAMLLGHSSLNTTMVYTTPGMSDLDRAVRVLDG